MARRITWGTPGRSSRYLIPRPPGALLLPALAAAAGVTLLLLLAYGLGRRGTLSPGAVVAAHAAFEDRCETCHAAGGGVPNRRCERCHDILDERGLTHRAHVRLVDLVKGETAPLLACAGCHGEHRGRHVDPVRRAAACGTCHFSSFSDHGESALAREEPGLRFAHDTHLARIETGRHLRGEAACLECHQPGAEDFVPLSFPRHCAGCHLKEGSLGATGPLPVAEAAPVPGGPEFRGGPGVVSKTLVRHADPWVVAGLRRLLGELSREAVELERGQRQRRLLDLQRQARSAVPVAAWELSRLREQAAYGPKDAALRERVEEELRLREAGVPPVPEALASVSLAALRSRLGAAEARSAEARLPPAPAPAALGERKRAAVAALAAPCVRCHADASNPLAPVSAARPRLARASFAHRPHLGQAGCAACHEGIERSGVAEQLHLPSIGTCRECHRARGGPQRCGDCHVYHPPAPEGG